MFIFYFNSSKIGWAIGFIISEKASLTSSPIISYPYLYNYLAWLIWENKNATNVKALDV